ncbi:hypothetical protein QWZ13_19535 [Reinekea marina]|nr:hypothetical protein [Reinekea marina]MDN3647540.1 hypothetical protein [Reinekea marina]MDN3651109.1 hypothetical protein [Reinekea marina]
MSFIKDTKRRLLSRKVSPYNNIEQSNPSRATGFFNAYLLSNHFFV